MAEFKWKVEVNPTTKESMMTAPLQGELISIAKEAIENTNGNLYFPATVSFENAQGNIVKRGCLVYQANFDYGMEVGTTYLGKIIKVKDKLPLVVLSHLDRASQASDDDFGIDLSMLEVADFDKVQKK